MNPLLEQRHLQFLNLLVRLITGPVTHLMHHLLFPFPGVYFLTFPQALQKLHRRSFSPASILLSPGQPKVFIIAINLNCTKQKEKKEKKKKIIQKRCVKCYMISCHLLPDKLLVWQAFARYTVFIVPRDINPNAVVEANLEVNLCLTFIYT